ncbi:MAG: hypothetical protein H6582_03010 [Crocinitomicaceae bacterium]|nr:hypothetical protein [Crocinitomicaceae bacterium]
MFEAQRITTLFLVFAILNALFSFFSCNDTGSISPLEVEKFDTIALTKTWEQPIPHLEIPEGLQSISAESCGSCHQEIYQEWQKSTHSVAFQDLQFQAEMKKDRVLVCLNCHTPLQDQQEYILLGHLDGDYKKPAILPNPDFDRKLQGESITCATCHVRDGFIIGFNGNTDSPHRTKANPGFLSEKLCLSCHNVVDQLSPVLVCSFETGDEWINNWASEQGKTCISCHMPETKRPIVGGFDSRKSHFHNFPGSGIPKFFDMEPQKLDGLSIEESNFDKSYKLGDEIRFKITIENKYAGHKVPTGDPERFVLITFRLFDEADSLLNCSIKRIGEEWEWYPKAKQISENNLLPFEIREYTYSLHPQKKGLYKFSVEVSKHRMTEKNAESDGILGKYPLSTNIHSNEYFFEVK